MARARRRLPCASRSASSATSSTIGHERRSNPLLTLCDPVAFTTELTRRIPARPPNVERVVGLNLEGAADPEPLPELDPTALARALEQSVCVLDIRDPQSFDRGHLEGSINLPAGSRGLGTRAGWAAGPEPIVLVSASIEAGRKGSELLRAAGVWNLAGLSVADPLAWRNAGLLVRTANALAADRVLPQIGDRGLTLVDVRDPAEWNDGHIATSRPLPLAELGDGRDDSLALEPPIAVICASGVRAAVAASILRRRGHRPVWRVTCGVDQLAQLGAPIVREQP